MKLMSMPDRLQSGSALAEFLAGRLGAPECWPDPHEQPPNFIRGRETDQTLLSDQNRLARARENRSLVTSPASQQMNHQETQS